MDGTTERKLFEYRKYKTGAARPSISIFFHSSNANNYHKNFDKRIPFRKRNGNAVFTKRLGNVFDETASITYLSARFLTYPEPKTNYFFPLINNSDTEINDLAESKNDSAAVANDTAELKNDFADTMNDFAELKNHPAAVVNDFAELKNDIAEATNDFAELRNDFAEVRNDFADCAKPFFSLKNEVFSIKPDMLAGKPGRMGFLNLIT